MRKECKQLIFIFLFFVLGCVIGYLMVISQVANLDDPEYIALWASLDKPVPEPMGFAQSMIQFGFLFSGIATGLIFFAYISKNWLTPIAPKIIIGIFTFLIYTFFGVIGTIPFVIYKIYVLLKRT